MKSFSSIVFCLVLSVGISLAQQAPPQEAQAPSADDSVARFTATRDALMATLKSTRPADWMGTVDAIWQFYGAYPGDPRANGLLMTLSGSVVTAQLAQEADRIALNRLFDERLDSAAVIFSARKDWLRTLLTVGMMHELAVQRHAPRPDLDLLRTKIEAVRARMPDHPSLAGWELSMVLLLEKVDPAKGKAQLEAIAGDPQSPNAGTARGILNLRESFHVPMQLRFTALDGREVDLAALRGKVVLIEFWATWCGPCIQELPNIKKVYADYRDRGFEVIGVSLDRAQDKDALLAFIDKNAMPWPQYFDGAEWKGPLVRKYSISGVPFMLLLDRSGRTVSTDARGEVLGREVRRLLER